MEAAFSIRPVLPTSLTRSRDKDDWILTATGHAVTPFLAWNDLIAGHFFRPEMAGESVTLYVTDGLIEEIGVTHQLGGVREFVEVMKLGPPWHTATGLCQRALGTFEEWRGRELNYPPYVGFLGLFVLAAGFEGDFPSHAYYPRLRTLIGEPPVTGQLPSFNRMFELWDDLERWANHDKGGTLGIFEAKLFGGMFHVDLPRSQSVLSNQERKALPVIFADAGLDSTSPPSDVEMARELRTSGAEYLEARTVRILSEGGDKDARAVLLDLIREALRGWDGSAGLVQFEHSGEESGGPTKSVSAGLRLCMKLDRPSGRVVATFRCVLNKRQFPEDGFAFMVGGRVVQCEEELPGWSTALTDRAGGLSLDASLFDWRNGLVLTESSSAWRFRFSGRQVRVLILASELGLPGLVEVNQVPRLGDCYVLYDNSEWHHLERWFHNCCSGFAPIEVLAGLPSTWRLAKVSGVHANDATIARRYPVLSMPERIQLRFSGGVHSAPGSSFFSFAPPNIIVESESVDIEVRCQGAALAQAGDGLSYGLPTGVPNGQRIPVEAFRNQELAKRLSFYLTPEPPFQPQGEQERFDSWGAPLSDETSAEWISGALTSFVAPAGQFRVPIQFVVGQSQSLDRRIFFVGRVAGEVAVWPSEALPEDWEPVWAVPMGRRGRVIFCGGDLDKCEPVVFTGEPQESIDIWKDLLWQRRKQIAPPVHGRLAALWHRYLEAARDI